MSNCLSIKNRHTLDEQSMVLILFMSLTFYELEGTILLLLHGFRNHKLETHYK